MRVIALLLLLGPGAIVWKLCDDSELNTAGSIVRAIFTLLLDSVLILLVSYLVLNLIYGRIAISFSPTYYENIPTSIYSVSFVSKYGILSGCMAVGWAMVKIVAKKLWCKLGWWKKQ